MAQTVLQNLLGTQPVTCMNSLGRRVIQLVHAQGISTRICGGGGREGGRGLPQAFHMHLLQPFVAPSADGILSACPAGVRLQVAKVRKQHVKLPRLEAPVQKPSEK